jgi:hypothetical protein
MNIQWGQMGYQSIEPIEIHQMLKFFETGIDFYGNDRSSKAFWPKWEP